MKNTINEQKELEIIKQPDMIDFDIDNSNGNDGIIWGSGERNLLLITELKLDQ